MKNRLLAYGFGPDEPKTSKGAKMPGKKSCTPKGKGKRLICRLTNRGKLCIYLDGAGQYYIRGKAVSPSTALRAFALWLTAPHAERDFIDEGLMAQLVEAVLPYCKQEQQPEADSEDDDDGDDWKASAE